MHRRTHRIIAVCLAAVAAVAAITAVTSGATAPSNLAKTIEVQRRLTTERPNDAAVFNDLGNLLLLAQKPAEAEAAYRRALELDPDKVSALFNLGLLRQQRGDMKEAMQLYQRAVKVDPDHAWAHYQLGSVHEALHQKSRAVDEYARAFSLDPQLAFPETNPHIVENKLLTESMLRAYRSDASPLQMPKVYDDGGRIAALLVPPPAPAQDAGKDSKAAAAQAAKPPIPASAAARAGMSRPPAGVKPGATVLRERDLDKNNPSGQALPSGLARPTTAPGRPQAQTGAGGLRQWNRPEPTVQQEVPVEQPDVENDGGQPAPIVTPPPGGVYYRPGLPSTGRLDLDLAPSQAKMAQVTRDH